jgi:hypothetical protein
VGNSLYFVPSDLIGTEIAYNWYNCYSNWAGTPYPWLGALAWIKYAQEKMSTMNQLQKETYISSMTPALKKAVTELEDVKYFNRLMQTIPYGIADGSLSSSFATKEEVIEWLMRSVALEEYARANGKIPKESSSYIDQSKVLEQGNNIIAQAMQIARAQGPDAARAYLNNNNTYGQSSSSSLPIPNKTGISTTTTVLPTRKTPTMTRTSQASLIPRMTLRGPNATNQTSIDWKYIAIPIALYALLKR